MTAPTIDKSDVITTPENEERLEDKEEFRHLICAWCNGMTRANIHKWRPPDIVVAMCGVRTKLYKPGISKKPKCQLCLVLESGPNDPCPICGNPWLV